MITPGPWRWVADGMGPENNWGGYDRGPIDIDTFQSKGYYGNPILCGLDMENDMIISAGSGEYSPVHGKTREEKIANMRAIAQVPEMVELLQMLVSGRQDLQGWAKEILDNIAHGRAQ